MDGILQLMKDLNVTMLRKMSEIRRENPNLMCKVPSITQMKVMFYLMDNKDKKVYQRDLEDVLKVRRATVSSILNKLEDKGFIIRKKDEKDSRRKRIFLTDKVSEISERGENHLHLIEQISTRDVDEDELNITKKVLKKMIKNINDYSGGRDA